MYYQYSSPVNNVTEKSFERMTILTKYVSYNNSALINCHFATYGVHLYVKCVTHLTKFMKQTIFRIRHFWSIKYGFTLKQQYIKSSRVDKEIIPQKKRSYIDKTMQENEQFSYDIPVSHTAALTPWRHSSSRAKSAWFKTRSGVKSGFPEISRKLLMRSL